MIWKIQTWCKHQPIGTHPVRRRFPAKIFNHKVIRPEQPQHASVDFLQKRHPDVEYRSANLPCAVEAAKHEGILGKSGLLASWDRLCNLQCPIVDLICIRKMDNLFRIELLLRKWRGHAISKNIVHEFGASRRRIAKVCYLNRRGSMREDSK